MRQATTIVRGALAATAAAVSILPATAHAAPTPEDRAVSWITGQLLPDGGVPGVMEGTSDWGLTLDVLFTAVATGAPDKPVNQMWQGIREHAVDYAGPSYGSTRGGASAKVLLGALVVGDDPTALPDGNGRTVDMLAQTSALIERTPGTRHGRVSDVGGFDNGNTFGQALAVMAFAHPRVVGTHRDDAQAVVEHLLSQQCRAGYWRMFSVDGQTCDEADPRGELVDNDATAMSLMALRSARTAGLDVPDAAIDRGLDDLVRRQQADGSFGGGVSTAGSNANSTGLATSVLALSGRSEAAAKGRAYVLGLQAPTSGLPAGSTSDAGAIAYDARALVSARQGGIGPGRDQWRRTTAQAVLALAPASYGELEHTFAPVAPPSTRPTPSATTPAPGTPSSTPAPSTSPAAAPTTRPTAQRGSPGVGERPQSLGTTTAPAPVADPPTRAAPVPTSPTRQPAPTSIPAPTQAATPAPAAPAAPDEPTAPVGSERLSDVTKGAAALVLGTGVGGLGLLLTRRRGGAS